MASYLCLKMQEPLGIITGSDDGSEGRTCRVIQNTEPGRVLFFLLMLSYVDSVFCLELERETLTDSYWQLYLLATISSLHCVILFF